MTTPKKTWLRPTQLSRTFPSNKYQFSTYLTKVGDFVETESLDDKQRNNIIDAAHAWAWFHKKTVKCQSTKAPDGGFYVRVTLIKQHRYRDYA